MNKNLIRVRKVLFYLIIICYCVIVNLYFRMFRLLLDKTDRNRDFTFLIQKLVVPLSVSVLAGRLTDSIDSMDNGLMIVIDKKFIKWWKFPDFEVCLTWPSLLSILVHHLSSVYRGMIFVDMDCSALSRLTGHILSLILACICPYVFLSSFSWTKNDF